MTAGISHPAADKYNNDLAMLDNDNNDPQADFEIAGQKASFRNYSALSVMSIITILGTFLALFFVYNDIRSEIRKAQDLTISEHAKLGITVEALGEAISVQTYILTLTQAERERLNLSMPESLRKRLR